MNNSSILFLRSNPVDPDSRVEKEVNCLSKNKKNVEVLAWDRSSKYKVREDNLILENASVKIYRFGIPASYGEGIKNMKAFITFQLRMFKWLVRNNKSYDIIHACDFDTALTAYYYSRLFKKKLVFDIFDYLCFKEQSKINIFNRYIIYMQKKIINNSNGTIICTEQRKSQIKGTKPENLAIIHNSPQYIEYDLIDNKLANTKIKIVYVGILQDYRLLKELIQVVIENTDYELHIGGFGKYESYISNLSLKHSNIIFYGKLTYRQTLQLENSCDIMTALYDPKLSVHYYAAPNKFYEALMLGKPIIMVKGTGMSNVVKDNNIGELTECDINSLRHAIERLVNRKEFWPVISNRMKEIYKKDYSWDRMEKRLIDFYGNL